jgi:hypothetical protein
MGEDAMQICEPEAVNVREGKKRGTRGALFTRRRRLRDGERSLRWLKRRSRRWSNRSKLVSAVHTFADMMGDDLKNGGKAGQHERSIHNLSETSMKSSWKRRRTLVVDSVPVLRSAE